jgi:catechol 2,3-dioxygenase-like lactoylglutathione lyase family enzyme
MYRGRRRSLQHLSLISLVVPDYDEALDFYVGTMGFECVEDTRLSDTKRWVVVRPRGPGAERCGLLLAKAATPGQQAAIGNQSGGRVLLFLNTDDFEADHRRLANAGVHFVETPRHEAYGTVAVFEDPFGNRWDLLQTRSAAPA